MLTHSTVKDYTTEDTEDPYALFFVVKVVDNEPLLEQDVIQAAMEAMVSLFETEDEAVQHSIQAWLDGRIRKIVKRAKNSAWGKTANTSLVYREAIFGTAQVRAFQPVSISQQPSELKKLQVTGLQATEETLNSQKESPSLKVYVDEKLSMTTGKLVAQVGHAVQLFIMEGEPEKVETWLRSNRIVYVQKTTTIPEGTDSQVHDAGFTEVPAGSLTAAAQYVS